MTNKEEIEWLEKEAKRGNKLKISPLLVEMAGTAEKVYEESIKAMKKQIPKRPILKSGESVVHINRGNQPHEMQINKWQDWVCPVCGWFVGQRYNVSQCKNHDKRKSNYCNECGQRIDWGEEK